MPPTTPGHPPAVRQPPHPLYALTTYELAAYRRDLGHAVAFFDTKSPVPLARDTRQGRLAEVTGEQAERARLAAHA